MADMQPLRARRRTSWVIPGPKPFIRPKDCTCAVVRTLDATFVPFMRGCLVHGADPALVRDTEGSTK